jgi:hypothetical protein
MRPLRALVAGLVAGSLTAGCAAPGAVPRPSDFSRQTSTPQVDLSWNLTQDGPDVQVDGLAVAREPELVGAILQLVGLDASGQVVATGSASVRWNAWFPAPFRIRVHSTAERFELRVARVTYPSGNGR